jgi:hypothetical protein
MKVTRNHSDTYNRYSFDFGCCGPSEGWAQVDTEQDASYYGIWANPTKLHVFSFVEGDMTLKEAESVEEFTAELRAIEAFEISQGRKPARIDPGLNEDRIQAFRAMGLEHMMH